MRCTPEAYIRTNSPRLSAPHRMRWGSSMPIYLNVSSCLTYTTYPVHRLRSVTSSTGSFSVTTVICFVSHSCEQHKQTVTQRTVSTQSYKTTQTAKMRSSYHHTSRTCDKSHHPGVATFTSHRVSSALGIEPNASRTHDRSSPIHIHVYTI